MPVLRLFACSLFVALFVAPAAHAQEVSSAPLYPCRDAYNEPVPCTTVVIQAPPAVVVAPSVSPIVVSAPAPAPVVEPAREPPAHERDGGFSEWGLVVATVDVRRLHFTPHEPERLPAVARGLLVHGDDAPAPLVLGGFSLVVGGRPVPFLRFPEVRLGIYGGDVEAGSAPTAQQGEVSATMTSLLVVRADLGLGLEAHEGPFGFYATARAGIAGYFADVRLMHASLGDFGRATLAEDALEVGWELAASLELVEGLSLQVSAEGMHLGAETLAGSLRVVGTY